MKQGNKQEHRVVIAGVRFLLAAFIFLAANGARAATFTERLFSKDPAVSFKALDEIGAFPDASKVKLREVLIGQLKSKDKKIRRTAVAGIEKCGEYDPPAIAALVGSLAKDSDSQVRLFSAEALGRPEVKDDPEAVAALFFRMLPEDEDRGVRQACALTLIRLGRDDKRVEEYIRETLKDKDPRVRAWTIGMLAGENGMLSKVEGAIRERLKDKDSSVRDAAGKILKNK